MDISPSKKKLKLGFVDGRTDGQTDMCDFRVAFATTGNKFWPTVHWQDELALKLIGCWMMEDSTQIEWISMFFQSNIFWESLQDGINIYWDLIFFCFLIL